MGTENVSETKTRHKGPLVIVLGIAAVVVVVGAIVAFALYTNKAPIVEPREVDVTIRGDIIYKNHTYDVSVMTGDVISVKLILAKSFPCLNEEAIFFTTALNSSYLLIPSKELVVKNELATNSSDATVGECFKSAGFHPYMIGVGSLGTIVSMSGMEVLYLNNDKVHLPWGFQYWKAVLSDDEQFLVVVLSKTGDYTSFLDKDVWDPTAQLQVLIFNRETKEVFRDLLLDDPENHPYPLWISPDRKVALVKHDWVNLQMKENEDDNQTRTYSNQDNLPCIVFQGDVIVHTFRYPDQPRPDWVKGCNG